MNEWPDPQSIDMSGMAPFLEAIRAPIQTVLTARDHFAITALAGLLYGYSRRGVVASFAQYATEAYGIADAMLEARAATGFDDLKVCGA